MEYIYASLNIMEIQAEERSGNRFVKRIKG